MCGYDTKFSIAHERCIMVLSCSIFASMIMYLCGLRQNTRCLKDYLGNYMHTTHEWSEDDWVVVPNI